MDKLKKLDKKLVAKNVAKLIAESNIANEEIANMLDISTRLIYYWQNGKRVPSTEDVYGLAQIFNVPMESILA